MENNQKSKIVVKNGNLILNKKLAKGINMLCKAQGKKIQDIIDKNPQKSMFIIHFGKGEEEDYETLQHLLNQYGKHELYIFPGNSFGYVEFEQLQDSIRLMNKVEEGSQCNVENNLEISFPSKKRNVFFFYSKIDINDLASNQFNIPNGQIQIDIQGLIMEQEYITKQEETELFTYFDSQEWTRLSNRRVQHYGYDFIYGTQNNNVNQEKQGKPFPDVIMPILEKIQQQILVLSGQKQYELFDQLTVNDYFPGDGIPSHIDTHSPFQEFFVSLSIGSGVIMSFKKEKQEKHIYFPERTLTIFSGEGRYAWSHMIACRKLDRVDGKLHFRRRRISLTFRKLASQPCRCEWPIYCDSQKFISVEKEIQNEINNEQDTENPTIIEKKHVYEIYDKIANHFDDTRQLPWKGVGDFLKELEHGSIVADVGCGNGKYLNLNENIYIVGTDRCLNLLKTCVQKNVSNETFAAESLKIPLKNNSVDAVISIAVIHHFSKKQQRIKAIQELVRIVKPLGLILIYVWAFEQSKDQTSQDVFVPWNLQMKFVENNDESIVNADKKTVVYQRYYHLFNLDEINSLINQIENIQIKKIFYEDGNHAIIIQKS